MRDAAIYVVALFMPMALAASIWPRWSGALRRTGELVVVVIASKFVIVSIIALAASLLAENDGGIEPLLAASALMLLACFSPFLLLRLVPFAEGAMDAAYSRRSAAGGSQNAMQLTSQAQRITSVARSNWDSGGSPPQVWNVGNEGGGGSGKGGSGGPDVHPGPSGKGGGGGAAKGSAGASAKAGAGAEAGGAAAAGAGPAGAVAAAPAMAAHASQSFADRLKQSGTAQAISKGGESAPPSQSSASRRAPGGAEPSQGDHGQRAPEEPPRPPQELPVKATQKKERK